MSTLKKFFIYLGIAALVVLFISGTAGNSTVGNNGETKNNEGTCSVIGLVTNSHNSSISILKPDDNTLFGPYLPGQLGIEGSLMNAAITPGGKIAVITNYNSYSIYFIELPKEFQEPPTFLGSTNIGYNAEDLSITPDGRFALISFGGGDDYIAIAEIATHSLITTQKLGPSRHVSAIEIAADGKTVLAIDSIGRKIHVLLLDEVGNLTFNQSIDLSFQPGDLSISPDGQLVIIVNESGSNPAVLKIDSPGKVSLLQDNITLSNGYGSGVAFSKNGKKAFYLSKEKSATYYHELNIESPGTISYSGTSMAEISAQTDEIRIQGNDIIAFEPNDKYAYIAAPASNDIAVIDRSTNLQIDNLNINGFPTCIAFGCMSATSDNYPFGDFETPLNGSTVASSIAVTGWALDDVGVESVKIYREAGGNLYYIGDALFVEGARPDIAQAYPNYPNNTKAGWGYMLLTNFLPGGDGRCILHAIATDSSGQKTTLGIKTIYVNNASAVKPFGAIDTPQPGEVVTGTGYRIQGWALTPLPNKIPENGSTIKVYIDDTYIGNCTYNVYRSDIANYFPGYANSSGAGAYFDINPEQYSVGVHRLYWIATDNAGNSDGIGSRYFSIAHTGTGGTEPVVLSESTANAVTNISNDGMTITFSSNAAGISDLETGDFIVGGVSNTFPYGILREVTGVSSTSTSYVVNTRTACIEDIIEEADISTSVQLTPSSVLNARTINGAFLNHLAAADEFSLQLVDVVMYDFDGNYNTTDDQVKLNGEVRISPQLDFDLKMSNWAVQEFKTTYTFTENVEVIANADLQFDLIDKSVTLLESYLTPITFMVPVGIVPVPVVITPKIEIVANIKGEAYASFQFGAGAGLTSTVGLQYSGGNWNILNSLTQDFYSIGPTLDAGLNVKGQVGPEFSLLLYGITGPYFNVNVYGELIANINEDPWWCLYGGFNAGGGVRLEILSHTLLDYSVDDIIDYRIELACAEGGLTTGTIEGYIKSASTGNPISGATVSIYRDSSLYNVIYSDGDGKYTAQLPIGTYSLIISKEGYLDVSYNNVTVESEGVLYLETVMQVDTQYAGTGTVSGRIVNAFDGSGINSAYIQLREGINSLTGTVIKSTYTDSSGYYTISSLNAGNYTAQVSKSGFHGGYFSIVCLGGQTVGDQNYSLSPEILSGQIRVVLTWGENPWDLDSHMTGPTSGGSRFHVYWWEKGSSSSSPYCELDYDDVTSYGPETITIYQQLSGVYRYSVHNFSDGWSSSSYSLSASGAKVVVYGSNGILATFNVPTNRGGTLWTVFELNGTVITPVNTMSYESNSGSITSFQLSETVKPISTDVHLIRNLPEK